MVLYSRKDDNGKYQKLFDHLQNVSALAQGFSKAPCTSKLSGLLHDLGKATYTFQNYLVNDGKRGSVIHSFQGAFFADDIVCKGNQAETLLKQILQLIILSHHNQLFDGVSPDGTTVFYEKIDRKNDSNLDYTEVRQNINELSSSFSADIDTLFQMSAAEINLTLNKLKQCYRSGESAQFALGLFVKYLYSCLIDADRLDAYVFEVSKTYRNESFDWTNLISVFEEKIKLLNKDSQINEIRSSISQKCKDAAIKETGIYQLSVPTGGGKTFSSMRFALHHAKKYNKKNIIYVIPYLSIIEQTAKSLRDIFDLHKDSDIIFEHHSSIVTPDEDEDRKLRKLTASRWDKPIIITTMVQFLETVMSSRASKLRKFHNMQDSVIIFDEIQFLPVNTVHLFNEVASFLSKILGATILLCTATQPLIGNTNKKNLMLAENPNLIDGVDDSFATLKRTNIVLEKEKDVDDFADFIVYQANCNLSCLVIVNTKKTARDLYLRVKNLADNFKVFHLSTSMCSAHRFDVLEDVKECLKNKQNVICISTQLIEAGVDISFACVIRAMAGLDSILQAAGRCNRNGECGQIKNVYVVPVKNENLNKLQDIKAGKENAQRIFYENPGADFLSREILDKYYNYYFFRQNDIMNFPTNKNQSVYEMLSENKVGVTNYSNRTGRSYGYYVRQAFASADESFYVIANNTQSVVVDYGEAASLVSSYKETVSLKDKMSIIRRLETLSVSLYRDYELEQLIRVNAINVLDDEFGIQILDKNYYNDEIGVTMEIDIENLIV